MKVSIEKIKELRARTNAGITNCKKALENSDNDIEKAIQWLKAKGIASASKKMDRTAAEGLAKVAIKANKAVILEMNCETDFAAKGQEFENLVEKILKILLEQKNIPKTINEILEIKDKNETISDYIKAAIGIIGENINLRRFAIIENKNHESFGSYIHMRGKIATLIQFSNFIAPEIAKEIAIQVAADEPKYFSFDLIPKQELENARELILKEVADEKKPANIIDKIVDGRLKKYFAEYTLSEQTLAAYSNEKIGDILNQNNVKVIKIYRYKVGEGIEKQETNFADEVMSQIKK